MGIEQVVDLLACPHCQGGLLMADGGRGVRCGQGHRFDLARQGYLNLLPGPQPANADTAAMVKARERFLATGAFDPISAAVIEQLRSVLPTTARVVDAGAGTAHLLSTLLDGTIDARGIAVDVSTAAARRAGRAHPRIGAVVADIWRRLPLAEAAADVVISNFAPRNVTEFARVLAPDGLLLTVTPTADHLVELRRTYGLLEIQPGKADRLTEKLSDRFRLIAADRMQHGDHWPAAVVADAIAMGPNAFHDRTARPEPDAAVVTVSVDLQLWRRRWHPPPSESGR